MKSTIRLSVFMMLIFIAYSCLPIKRQSESGNLIVPLSDTVTLADGGLVYGLPRTVFTVFVEMERTIEKPGPYARYARDLLGLNKVIQSEGEFWSVQRIIVKAHEELDPSEYYVIKSNNIFLTNVLALKKEGLILDLNPAIFYNIESQTGTRESDDNQLSSFDLGSDEYFQLQRDTAYKRVNIDSLFIRIPYIVEKKKILSVEQLAERAAQKLMEMREGKHLILTGEANVFPQSDAAINEMNRIEKDYTELFVGKIRKETKLFTYQFIPKKEMVEKPVILFRFSELTGPVSGASKGGIPVTAELIPEQKTKSLTILNSQQVMPAAPKYDKLFYRVPDVVNMKISMGPEILFNSRRLIYQFGEVIQLPANYIIGK
ncbi:MAG TPA: DUF4831 family protein [Bacteroidales bacterium]|nr:DUF4831 family protein [Bacteroidales bacterium]